jgi:cholest-4-en-3-one 26-monooxygenase
MDLTSVDVVSNDVYLNDVPHDQLALLRRQAPVFCQQVPDPDLVDQVWVITRYVDVERVSLDAETYSSQRNGTELRRRRPGALVRIAAGAFIGLDDPVHKRMRDRVARGFTPRVVRTFERHYRELTARAVERALAQGSFDFVAEVSAELPILAICELLGVPEQDRAQLIRWSNDYTEYGNGPDAGDQAIAALGRYALGLARTRRDDPRDDILSALATAPDGERLTDEELEGFVVLLAVAGSETSRNNISLGLLALMQHPDQLDALRADPDKLLDSAVEEITRWASPLNYSGRTAMRDTELSGKTIRAGDRVAMFYSSANRDEDAFLDAHSFDITRSGRRHLAFGVGRHYCLGAHLARIETRAVFAELLPRVAQIKLAGPVVRLRSSFIHGIQHLPVTTTPA